MDGSPRRQKFSIEYNGAKYDCERIIHGQEVFRQTITVCGFGSREDDEAYSSKDHNIAIMPSAANVIAVEIIEQSLEKIQY